jgi:hypothetical protein
MITLPPEPDRPWLISFWSVLALFASIVSSSLLLSLSTLVAVVFGLGLIFAAVVLSLVYARGMALLYKSWNKLAREFESGARRLLVFICFAIVVAAGRTGSSLLDLTRPSGAGSLWQTRGTHALSSYKSPYTAEIKSRCDEGWISSLLPWTLYSGNLWAACLLPFLILLWALRTPQESSVPSNVYTLF